MKKICTGITLAAACLAPWFVQADPATPDPDHTQVQTHLRIDVDKKTDTIHWISTTNDPDIITKTYVLKHADPYEIRPYLRDAVSSERITGGDSKVECVKYNDGTGVVIVSAEDYKFDKKAQNGGMIIDELVEIFDQPQITSSSGKGKFLYFPKERSAADLAALLHNVGFARSADTQELLRGKDEAFTDDELNAIWFYVSNWSIKHIKEMLDVYDKSLPEVKVRYSIYEISNEGDDKLGVDFQAWKNGPGSDLFTAAARFSNGWDMANNQVGSPWLNNEHTRFIKFSPKWNSRYLDVLAAKGKAAVMTSGTLSIQNVQEGRVQALTQYPAFAAGAANASLNLFNFARMTDADIRNHPTNPNAIQIDNDYDADYDITIIALDSNGEPIRLSQNTLDIDFEISRVNDGERTSYYLQMEDRSGVNFVNQRGENLGSHVRCWAGDFSDGDITWSTDNQYTVQKDNDRDTDVNNLATASDAYGFSLRLIPSVTENSTTLDVNMYNTSLIGFRNDGTPRTERSEFNTKVMVSNSGSKFVIGGINKKEVTNSVSKVPYLGDIPGLGWAFSSESAVTKKSQIVAVLDCVPVLPDTQVDSSVMQNIEKLTDKVKSAGQGHHIGFDQFLLDEDKQSLDPLP